MAIVLTGTKTVTHDVSPTHTAATLTTIFATAPENLTYGNLQFLFHCCQSRQGGEEPNTTLTSLFS
jgi:hypothetical protein